MRVAVLVRSRVWGGLETHALGLVRTLLHDGHGGFLACIGRATADMFKSRDPAVPLELVELPSNTSAFSHWVREFRGLEADACVFEKGTLHTGSLALDAAARRVFGDGFVSIEQLEPPLLTLPAREQRTGIPRPALWRHRQRLHGWLRSLGPKRVICISEAVRSALHADYGFASGRLMVIPNGVDIECFHPSARGDARRQQAVADDTIVLATACRLIPQKGVDVALRAFAKVLACRGHLPVVFLVAGEGPERPALEQLSVELGIRCRTRFVGFVADPTLFIPAADVVMVPSRIEAQGIIVLEALASGCHLIATRVGGIPEMIPDERLGALVPPGDIEAWAQALDHAIERARADRSADIAAAREHVATHFSAQAQGRRVIGLVQTLLSNEGG